MDIYYTIEEKYLQAVDELNYGESPRALKLLNEIVANNPEYALAHYQLGLMYYYNIGDYKAAGYHLRLCTEIEPSYPDVYYHYLKLIIFLNMEKQVNGLAKKALLTPGVDTADIYNLLGLYAEKNRRWNEAIAYYRKALFESTGKKYSDDIEQSINRVNAKQTQLKKYNYHLSE